MAERIMRVLKKSDLDSIVAIDAKITKQDRREYYERKIAAITDPALSINASIVADVDGKVVGFIMGDVYSGEFGISRDFGDHRQPRRRSLRPEQRPGE
jgi:hypothetical protein